MKISVWVTVSDLISTRQTLIEKSIELFDKKSKMFHSLSLEHIFQSLKQSGVDGIELLVPLYTSDNNLKDIQKIITRNTIPIFSIHQSLSSRAAISDKEIEKLCQIAKMFSSSIVVLHSGALGKQLLDSNFIIRLKNLQKIYGIKFGIENMDKDLFPMQSFTYRGAEFSSLLNKTDLYMTFDTTHLAQAGGKIIPFYLENKERIINIHISDYKKTLLNTYVVSQAYTHLPLGEGELPLGKFLTILKEEKYKGLITMEVNAGLTQLCKSAEMIKSYA